MSQNEDRTQSVKDRIMAFSNAGTSEHLTRTPFTKPPPPRPSITLKSESNRGNLRENLSSLISTQSSIDQKSDEAERKNVRAKVLPPPTNVVRTGQNLHKVPKLPPRNAPNGPPSASNDKLVEQPTPAKDITAQQVKPSQSVKAPAFDPRTLPALPNRLRGQKNMNGVSATTTLNGPRPALASQLLQRQQSMPDSNDPHVPTEAASELVQPLYIARKLPPPSGVAPNIKIKPATRSSAVEISSKPMTNQHQHCAREGESFHSKQHPVTTSPISTGSTKPPPVPLSSRPNLSRVTLSSSLNSTSRIPAEDCLLCRDFSTVDHHATKYPRQQVPSIDWLATNLTTPFPSHTDRARVIFTWLHHNIAYDTGSFFAGSIKASTPTSTLKSGLAVCEGYAALFNSIAVKAGLECMIVGGHGKGFGFAEPEIDAPIPRENPSGHAWNAVRIDNGKWKLMDATWGAGHISGTSQLYTKHFSPRMFTMSNADFALRHYPSGGPKQFFLDDGVFVPTWEEYLRGPLPRGQIGVQVYSGVAESEGIQESSIFPRERWICTAGSGTVRFSFERVCEHWIPEKNGQGRDFVFVLAVHGIGGLVDDYLPFEMEGRRWWCDVEKELLGSAGQNVSVYTVDSVDGASGRGLGINGYRAAKGRKGMGFGGLAAWELV